MAQAPYVQKMELTARSMDVASAGLRLANLDLVSIASKASTITTDLVKWIAREGLSSDAFVGTMTLGQDITHPNYRGLDVLNQVGNTSSRFFALKMVMPGALGRTILADEKLRWMVSTTAVLLKYQDAGYTATVLRDLILEYHMNRPDIRKEVAGPYVKLVLDRVVSSLHLHTTNMGVDAIPLPDCVAKLPRHFLSSSEMAVSVARLLRTQHKDIFLQLSCCFTDLIDWILHHWSGNLRVSFSNEFVVNESLGDSGRSLTVMIGKPMRCAKTGDCELRHSRTLKLGKLVSLDIANNVADETWNSNNPSERQPSCRTPLYEIRNPLQTFFASLNATEQNIAAVSAQGIVRSILDLPVLLSNQRSTSLKIDKSSTTTYRWWLKKTPTLLQKNTGYTSRSRLLFTGDGVEFRNTKLDNEVVVIRLYPEIHSALELVSMRCECGREHKDKLDPGVSTPERLDRGCLMALMLTEITLQIAHAMAEAGGASDISNLRGDVSASILSSSAVYLLRNIAVVGEIEWRYWFRIVAGAITGFPQDVANTPSEPALAKDLAWVAGSMTIVPAWFTMDRKIELEGSWSVSQLTGSVMGLEHESAIIETQAPKTDNIEFNPISTVEPISLTKYSRDVVLETVIFPVGKGRIQIAFITTVGSIRTICPFDIYTGALRAFRPVCGHKTTEDVDAHLWSLEGVLQNWNGVTKFPGDIHMSAWSGYKPSTPLPEGEFAHVVAAGGAPLNCNVILGFTLGFCVLQDGQCCYRCFAKAAKEKQYFGVFCGGSSQEIVSLHH